MLGKNGIKVFDHIFPHKLTNPVYRVSQKWRTNYLLPYRGCLNVLSVDIKNWDKIQKYTLCKFGFLQIRL
jgi:hypothetical protein